METYYGHVRTPADAIILFEACRIGLLPRVQRRLSEKERQSIRSGSVFVWDEREAGMRRWTDGKSWSASRVSGSFLTYREMEGKRGGGSSSVAQSAVSRAGKTPESTRGSDDDRGEGPDEGPDGYRYKPDGLMKQSFSITTSAGQHLHLISYYSRSHPAAANLQQPSTDPALRHVRPQKGLYPESTVNDQQNLPVVTRGPMPGAAYTISPHPMGGYPRHGASHPQSYTPPYAWPPTPMGTPPAMPVAYGPGPSYLPPVTTANDHVAYAQPHHSLPPPPSTQPGLPHQYERPVHHHPPPHHQIESTLPNVPVTGPPSMSAFPGRSPRLVDDAHQRSPPGYGAVTNVSPRLQSQHAPQHGLAPRPASPRLLKQPPTALPLASPNPPPRTAEASTGTTVPSIEALVNGAPPGPLPAITPASGSPHGAGLRAEGPRDIPSEKIGFGGEDMRALRQLDRVFTA